MNQKRLNYNEIRITGEQFAASDGLRYHKIVVFHCC